MMMSLIPLKKFQQDESNNIKKKSPTINKIDHISYSKMTGAQLSLKQTGVGT
jgi:hypothetical protein